jgi:acetylornithine deacetylase/succinyl-diaminopimelate desuccinylase family protein
MAVDTLKDLLTQLVAIPSVNPDHTDDAAIAGEARLAGFLAERLERLGFRAQLDGRVPGRPNLVAEYGPADARRTILLESHMDTVGVSGMAQPFAAMVRDGRLHGRGTCDTKGPMAAALHALEPRILERLATAGCRVIFAGAMGEETGNIGAAQLAAAGLRADQAIILEPTELAIVHAHKGALWMEIEVRGVAAHGSNPGRGVNAICGMSELIGFLQQQSAGDQALRNPVLGSPSLNIGTIRGGTAVNIVADRCVIQVDRRALPEEDPETILERIRAQLALMQKTGRIASHELRILKSGAPFQTSADSGLVRELAAACRSAGVEPKTEGAAWYSDAGPLADVCRELVVFGPGSIAQAHTADEFIDLDSLQKGSAIIRGFLSRVGDGA